MEQWIDFTTTELDAPLLSWVLPILGHWPYDKKVQLPPCVNVACRARRCSRGSLTGLVLATQKGLELLVRKVPGFIAC